MVLHRPCAGFLYGGYQKYSFDFDETFKKCLNQYKNEFLKVSKEMHNFHTHFQGFFLKIFHQNFQKICMAATKNTHPISTKLSKKVLKGLK